MMNGKKSVLAEAGDKREGTGLLCTDAAGLCLAAEGVSTQGADQAAGVYSSMMRLASQLQGGGGSAGASNPIITIETDETSTLVKSYDGHTVALTVPNAATVASTSLESNGSNGTLSEAAGSSSGEAEDATS